MLTDAEIIAKYGQPGDPSKLTIIQLPYRMRIAWDTSVTITKMQCHKLLATNFVEVFNDLKTYYGFEELQRLGIDLYSGCVNVRLQRGSKTKWSRHSWGIALDLDHTRNQLKWGKDKAQFAKPEYKPVMEIFYNHGFFNLGLEQDRDFMHFETNQ